MKSKAYFSMPLGNYNPKTYCRGFFFASLTFSHIMDFFCFYNIKDSKQKKRPKANPFGNLR